jgi:hypothetical protein
MHNGIRKSAINAAWRSILSANAAEPYDHAEYERRTRVAKGLLIAFTDGDQEYADALMNAFHDSNENVEWYLQWTRDELTYNF